MAIKGITWGEGIMVKLYTKLGNIFLSMYIEIGNKGFIYTAITFTKLQTWDWLTKQI